MIPCEPFITPDMLPCDLPDDPPASLATRAIDAASFVLWGLGGRRHGICNAEVRPCAPRCVSSGLWWEYGSGWHPVLYEGAWLNVCGCTSSTDCACGPVSEIVLPLRPVASIVGIDQGGTELVEGTDWRLDGSRLIRLGGESWPSCQNMAAAPGEADTLTVSLTWGTPVDALGQMAAGELACEFTKAMRGLSCNLPQRVQSVSRQGVTLALLDTQDFLQEGRTGLYMVDLWLGVVNPDRHTGSSMVWSPDVPAPRMNPRVPSP